MQTDNRFLDDMAKLATSALGSVQGAREEIEGLMKRRLERFLSELDVVPRDEFEATKALVLKLEKEVSDLRAQLDAVGQKPVRKSASKASSKKSS